MIQQNAYHVGVKMNFRRTKTVAQLEDLASEFIAAATEDVTITMTSSDGVSAQGVVTLPRGLALEVIEELIIEKGGYTPETARQIMTYPDYRQGVSRT